ncbi:MAG: prolyl aminopeptidase, partial [Rothia mucilaginosa]|nr:prolyl aminopeptidase [Rothia mucilaginosa]
MKEGSPLTVSSLPKVEYRKGSVVKHDGYEITDHWFQVPLTHGLIFSKGKDAALSSRFADQTITVFAREVVNTSETLTVPADKRPYIVYLQGGPGFGSPKTGSIGGWIAELAKTHRVILLDQRGTGLSSPLSARTITAVGDPQVQAEYT